MSVDSSRCEGHGICGGMAPEFFELDEEGYSSIGADKPVPSEDEARIRMVVMACPTSALSIDDD